LPLNSRSGRLRGRSGAPVESPVGDAGSANQNPKPVDPAAAFPRKVFVRIRDPEPGRPGIGGEDALGGGFGSESEIIGDQIAGFGPVLQEVAMAQVVVTDVALDPGIVGPVHGDAPVEALPNTAPGEVLAIDRSHHVPVHWVPGHEPFLPHEVELDGFHA
jgi:hypothetical protein